MAEFCKQCAEELDFEPDFTNLFASAGDPVDPKRKLGYFMLCEGCGPAFIVDDLGTCANPDCFEKHGTAETFQPQ